MGLVWPCSHCTGRLLASLFTLFLLLSSCSGLEHVLVEHVLLCLRYAELVCHVPK